MGIIPIEEAMKLSPTAREICLRLRKMSLDKIWYACLEQTHDREQAVELYTRVSNGGEKRNRTIDVNVK